MEETKNKNEKGEKDIKKLAKAEIIIKEAIEELGRRPYISSPENS